MTTRRTSVAVAMAGALTAFTLAGCGAEEAVSESLSEKAVEKAMEGAATGDVDVDFDSDSGGMTIEGEDGSMSMGQGGEIPEEFPDDVPVPAGDREIGFSMVTDEFVQVTMLIPGDVDEATEFIRSGLEESGYTIENKSNSQVGDQKSNTLEAVGNERRVVVVVGGGAEKEQMSVTYNIEPIAAE